MRLANSGIKRNIVDIPGAFDYLIAAGFRQVNADFEATLTFSPSPIPTLLHKLRCANFVLKEVNKRAIEAAEREKRFRESEVDAEKARVGKVMLGFEEDRRLKREKDARGACLLSSILGADKADGSCACRQDRARREGEAGGRGCGRPARSTDDGRSI